MLWQIRDHLTFSHGDLSMPVPDIRIEVCNHHPARSDGRYILYWMNAARRLGWNFALQRAVAWAEKLQRPLLVVETLPCDRPHANLRHHHFALDGMADNARGMAHRSADYYPFVERESGEIAKLLTALGEQACLVVSDLHPLRESVRATQQLADRLPILLERVDSNGILPLQAADREFTTAYSLRRFLQRNLLPHLLHMPLADPLANASLISVPALPERIHKRWPAADHDLLTGSRNGLRLLPIGQDTGPVSTRGGSVAARNVLQVFLREHLDLYHSRRNEPQQDVTSGLSPYLRRGHISSHEIVQRLLDLEGWHPSNLSLETRGQRSGWWGVRQDAEAFLDQLITWRELGYLFCARRDDYDRFESLPAWAQTTLLEHAADPRPYLYSLQQLETGQTHDPLWNAAQMQLIREGRLHNYLRMLWGKKILQWSPAPQQAMAIMLELNDRYALDGCDPNSYSGIGWVLGRFDRAWGPQRPVFGKIRYMSSRNTARKVAVDAYMTRYRP
jgi:deoxyribodipyrimidine photo-lyase